MGKHTFHIRRKGDSPEFVRGYNWMSKLFLFVERNPYMFKGRILTLYNHNKPITDVSYEEVKFFNRLGLKEKDLRRITFYKYDMRRQYPDRTLVDWYNIWKEKYDEELQRRVY